MPKTLNTDDFAPRYATRIDTNGHPIKVRVDLTPVLDAMAETNAAYRVKREAALSKRGAIWGGDSDGAIWGGLAEVTPIRPAVSDDELKAA